MARKSYDIEMRQYETKEDYYYRLATVSDARLRELEKLAKDPLFEGVENMAYKSAMRDIDVYGGKNRFKTKPPEVGSLMNEKIAAMRHFLSSPSSTKTGLIEVYKKSADTINQNYGTSFSLRDLALYFRDQADALAQLSFGSKTQIKAVGRIQQASKMIDEIDSGKKRSVFRKDPVTDAAIKMLEANIDIPGVTKEQSERLLKLIRG